MTLGKVKLYPYGNIGRQTVNFLCSSIDQAIVCLIFLAFLSHVIIAKHSNSYDSVCPSICLSIRPVVV